MDIGVPEGRFEVLLEQIRDALQGIESELEGINKKLGNFEECIDDRTQLKVIRVADMTRKP